MITCVADVYYTGEGQKRSAYESAAIDMPFFFKSEETCIRDPYTKSLTVISPGQSKQIVRMLVFSEMTYIIEQ